MGSLDRTFCVSKRCDNTCGRKLTEEIRLQAVELGRPLSVSLFCENKEVTVNDLLSALTGFPNLTEDKR